MEKASGAVAAVAIVLATSACASGHKASEAQGGATVSVTSRIIARSVSSSRLLLGGRVRCTATVGTPVAAGQRVDNTFSFRNLSSRPVGVYLRGGSLVLRSPDGTTYDTTLPSHIGGPPALPTRLRPGATRTVRAASPRVRWSGPLRTTPKCYGKALPTAWVRVTSPGAPPSERAAVSDVVAASGFLLRHCRPSAPGRAVFGRVDTPDGSAPAMPAACSVTVRRERGFFDAQVLVFTPPGQRERVRVRRPYEQLVLPKRTRPFEAIEWEFVVTRDGASAVAAETVDSDDFVHQRRAPTWTWTGTRWRGGGGDPCGGETIYGGFGVGADPTVEFISACAS